MHTDIFLQKALIREVEDELKGYTSVNNSGEYIKFNVYPQNLPAKEGKNDDKHFPYVIVTLIDEEIKEYGKLTCSVLFEIGITDKNPNNQGHFDIANVMNRLTTRFLSKPMIESRYRMEYPIYKKFQEESTYPKFIGGIITEWSLIAPEMEETEYD